MIEWMRRWFTRQQKKNVEAEPSGVDNTTDEDMEWEREIAIYNLSSQEAKTLFFKEVEIGTFEVRYAMVGNPDLMVALPQTVRELFSMVATVGVTGTGYLIDRNDFGPLNIYNSRYAGELFGGRLEIGAMNCSARGAARRTSIRT